MKPGREEALRSLVQVGQAYCDFVKKTLMASGLWDEGFGVVMSVNPTYEALTQEVIIKRSTITEEGKINYEGVEYFKPAGITGEWKLLPSQSTKEFTRIFEDETDRAGKHEGSGQEKPVPPDGLWV